MNMRIRCFAKVIFVIAFLALPPITASADEEQQLLDVLRSDKPFDEKCRACERLKVVGTVKAVPILGALLSDEKVSHAARYALESMPCPQAGVALREALDKTHGATKVGIVDSLGERREPESVAVLTPLISGPDAEVASSAAAALGKIGGKEAVQALTAAREKAAPGVQSAVCDGLLRCAEQMRKAGDLDGASAVCRGLYDSQAPDYIRTAAYCGLIRSAGPKRVDLIREALTGTDRAAATAALRIVHEVDGPGLAALCSELLPQLPPDAQIGLLDVLGAKGSAALPAVCAAAKGPDASVRRAALLALAELNDASTVALLAEAATRDDKAEREAAQDALARLHGAGVREAIFAAMKNAEPSVKVELIRALGERHEKEAAPVLLHAAGEGEEAVRLAALQALAELADEDTAGALLQLVLRAKSDADVKAARKALGAVCANSRDKTRCAGPVLAAFRDGDAAQRRALLPVLPHIATTDALSAVCAAVADKDTEMSVEAIRALAQWPTLAAAPHLLEIAKTRDEMTQHVLALRGYTALAALEGNAGRRLAMLQQALAVARRPEEKKQALGQFGQIRSVEAMQAALPCLADPNLADEASSAVVDIAEQIAASDPTQARDAMVKVLAHCRSESIRSRAMKMTGADKVYIRSWLVCGPYAQEGVRGPQGLFDLAFGPEKKGETVDWKPAPDADMVNLAAIFAGREHCVAYLQTQLVSPEDCDAKLSLGSDDGVKVWLNGEQVHGNNVSRAAAPDQDVVPITLRKGANLLLLKVTQGGGGWGVCVKVVRPDGSPIEGLRAEAQGEGGRKGEARIEP